tara:strand:+ start:1676 stop:1852 length:177 start_codon:yes stop_codon:yes gene_type:complete
MQHRMLAEDIANIFYKDTKDGNAEKSRGSLEYCKHVDAIEDIIEQFFQNNWNALDQNR